MAITFSTGSSTSWANERSLVANSTTLTASTTKCQMQTWVDATNLSTGDRYELKIYEKIGSTAKRLAFHHWIQGVQSLPGVVHPALLVGKGWDVTLKKTTSAANRTVQWSIRKVTT